MRMPFKKTLSAILAVGLLSYAVMLSVSSAEGPYRRVSDNAFAGPPLGHPDKALISTHWLDDCEVDSAPTAQAAFDWGFPAEDVCPKCGFMDAKVTPVVLDVPELLGPSDAAAIEVIKRKLGINAFRGSIFEDSAPPAAQLLREGAPPELKAPTCESACLSQEVCDSTTCSTSCQSLSTCDAANGCCEGIGTATAMTIDASTSPADSCANHAPDQTCAACVTRSCPANPETGAGLTAYSMTWTPRATTVSVTIEEDCVAALRRASVELDEAAMRQEAGERYDVADALRHAAQELRMKARLMKRTADSTQAGASAYVPAGRPVDHRFEELTFYHVEPAGSTESTDNSAKNLETAKPSDFQLPKGTVYRAEPRQIRAVRPAP